MRRSGSPTDSSALAVPGWRSLNTKAPCTVLSGDTLNALLAVDSKGARIALDFDVLGKPCIHLILEPDTALDLALRITSTVMRQRRAAAA